MTYQSKNKVVSRSFDLKELNRIAQLQSNYKIGVTRESFRNYHLRDPQVLFCLLFVASRRDSGF